ncbi:MAG: outer membrane beta-barrel family protein [Fermentimonas sp.]|nr:outer membrane beta-barrel family protein [Fermentimonas sp.]
MKHSFVFFMSFLLTATLTAQNITVNGRLISASDNKPLPYATIAVSQESSPEKSFRKFATKENGSFSTELEKGKYIFVFNFVGMDQVRETIDLTTAAGTYDIGDIKMSESSTELDELNVVAQKPLVKVEIDKLTYSAKDDPEASTSNVLDLLRKVPLVTVDGEDEIQLKGSSNFKIYVNGKPSNMVSSNPSQVLKSMPANSVKDIEVITDPGARYDAEGVGGIINIVTDKRVDDGYSGSVGANANTFGGYGGNMYLATKYGKFGFTGNAGYYKFKQPESETSSTREEFTPFPLNTLTQNGTSESNGRGLFLNGSMSFEPDTLNLFNLSVSRFGGKFNSLSNQQAISGASRPYSYTSRSNSISNYGGMNLSADYQRSFKKKGEMLTGSYRYERNPNDSEYDSEYDVDESVGFFYYPDGYQLKSVNDAGGDEHTIQVDYVNPLNGKHGIETGLKYIFRDNSSRADHTFFDVTDNSWKPDLDRKNDLDHSQNISSGYAGYSYKSGKVGMKFGLRAEHTQQDIHFMSAELDTVVGTNFFDLVPSATLSYQLGMTQTLRGGYNMRISRPGIWYLNPYINDVDPNNISYGNPSLDSEQQHNFNINYGSFSQKLNFNATFSYSFAKNAVTPYSFIVQSVEDGIEKSVTHNTYANIGRNHTLGTNIYASWTPSEMIRTYLNGGINYTDIQSTQNSALRNSGFSGRAFGGITFTFPKDLRVGANGGLFLNRVQLQTEQSPFYFYSFSMQKSFLDKKLDLSLNAQSLFSEYREFSSTTRGEGFTQKSKFLNPMRNLSLSVTYRFGDLRTSVKRVQRSITNEDVMQGESGTQQTGTAIPD